MGETADSINKKDIINLSRNSPTALVVGAASFLGSHVTDGLLAKGIQVIGIDSLPSENRRNLTQALGKEHFLLLDSEGTELRIKPHRLDYIFIVSEKNHNAEKIMELAKEYGSKVVFISSIELYQKPEPDSLKWLRETEGKVARVAFQQKINARIIRLSAVFGPRMQFKSHDPLIRLIRAALKGELDKETISLDFSTRALFVGDAVKLIIKSILAGGTAHKILDGCLYYPVRVSEIKLLLKEIMEGRGNGMKLTSLDPWPTPNLEKTMSLLNWMPQTDFRKDLQETVSFFKKSPLPSEEADNKTATLSEPKSQSPPPPTPMPEVTLPPHLPLQPTEEKPKEVTGQDLKTAWKKLISYKTMILVIAASIVFYALFYPLIAVGWGAASLKSNLTSAISDFTLGDFDKGLEKIKAAEADKDNITSHLGFLNAVGDAGIFRQEISGIEQSLKMTDKIVTSLDHAILGSKLLADAASNMVNKAPSGTRDMDKAKSELLQASEGMLKVKAGITEDDLDKNVLGLLLGSRADFIHKVDTFLSSVEEEKELADVLPVLLGENSQRSYLLLVEDNTELRPTGGVVVAAGEVEFSNGQLKGIEVESIKDLDKNLNVKVEPPAEIKQDLAQKSWLLRDSNWEPDFPTTAKQAAWFYLKEKGKLVDGVIALDLNALSKILEVIGPVKLEGLNSEINNKSLISEAIAFNKLSYAQNTDSSQFYVELTKAVLGKMFSENTQHWVRLVQALGYLLDHKSATAYTEQPTVFTYLMAKNWEGGFAGQVSSRGVVNDFAAVVESNMGENKVNYYLKRSFSLDTSFDSTGGISHQLKVDYQNGSPNADYPAGLYKTRTRVFLPLGSTINKISWNGSDMSKNSIISSEYGKTIVSLLVQLNPAESGKLEIGYFLAEKVKPTEKYTLTVVKQPGTGSDPLLWKFYSTLPFTLNQGKNLLKEYTAPASLDGDSTVELFIGS